MERSANIITEESADSNEQLHELSREVDSEVRVINQKRIDGMRSFQEHILSEFV